MIYSNLIITANYRKERSISYRNCLTKLTRNLTPNIYAGLIGFLREIINSDQFIKQYRQSPIYFIRQRKLTFLTLIFSLINKEMGLDLPPLKLRLLRVESDTGESEILITSLLDTQSHPHEQFAELYHLRWPVEEDYKKMKQWIEIENFSGKSVLSVYQDFHAKNFSKKKNLISALIYPTQAIIDKNTENHIYRYKRNFAEVLSKTKDVIPLLFLRPLGAVGGLISDIHEIVVKTIEPVRPGRKCPRNFNNRSGRFHLGIPAAP